MNISCLYFNNFKLPSKYLFFLSGDMEVLAVPMWIIIFLSIFIIKLISKHSWDNITRFTGICTFFFEIPFLENVLVFILYKISATSQKPHFCFLINSVLLFDSWNSMKIK